jgi:hypothetical protein
MKINVIIQKIDEENFTTVVFIWINNDTYQYVHILLSMLCMRNCTLTFYNSCFFTKLCNFIICGCESSAPFFVIYKARRMKINVIIQKIEILVNVNCDLIMYGLEAKAIVNKITIGVQCVFSSDSPHLFQLLNFFFIVDYCFGNIFQWKLVKKNLNLKSIAYFRTL